MRVGIWYPTKAAAIEADLGLFTQVVAANAPVDGHAHPLIVMSHGNGGSLERDRSNGALRVPGAWLPEP